MLVADINMSNFFVVLDRRVKNLLFVVAERGKFMDMVIWRVVT